MHDHIGALGQSFTCSDADDDRGGTARRCRHLPDHHAAGRRIHAIRGMAGNMGGTDSAHFNVAGGPHNLRLVFCLKGDRVDQVRGAAGGAFLDLGMALGDFARLE